MESPSSVESNNHEELTTKLDYNVVQKDSLIGTAKENGQYEKDSEELSTLSNEIDNDFSESLTSENNNEFTDVESCKSKEYSEKEITNYSKDSHNSIEQNSNIAAENGHKFKQNQNNLIKSDSNYLDASCSSRNNANSFKNLMQSKCHSPQEIINTLLHLLVDGPFNIDSNFLIPSSQHLLNVFENLNYCQEEIKIEFLNILIDVIRRSRRNMMLCVDMGFIEVLLSQLQTASEQVTDLYVELLSLLASISIRVKELKLIFRLLRMKEGKWPRYAVKLLTVLKQMPLRYGPDEFFVFPSIPKSCISIPPISKWPHQNGWTFNCWFLLDPIAGISDQSKKKPYLYCFRTNKGVGYSGHFIGNSLVITVMKVKGKGFQHCIQYQFQPRKWYMVTVVHIYNRWSRSELRCYVDGQIVSQVDMAWLVSANEVFDRCLIGSNPDQDTSSLFSGQISGIYLFSLGLTAAQVYATFILGPAYKGQFRFEQECPARVNDKQRSVLYDGKLCNSLVFTYNPMACDRQLCLDQSPKQNQASIFAHSPHALMNGEVRPVITRSIHSALHSLGGIQIFFPLFKQLKCPQEILSPDAPIYNISALLLSIMCDLVSRSARMRHELVQSQGCLVLSNCLEEAGQMNCLGGMVNSATLETLLRTCQYLSSLGPRGYSLLRQLERHLLCNPRLWIRCPVQVQIRLHNFLATDFLRMDTSVFTSTRRLSAVLIALHTLKYYYWVQTPDSRADYKSKAPVDCERPELPKLATIRANILVYIKHLVIRDEGIQDDELQAILNFLITVIEDDNRRDVIYFLLTLLADHPDSVIPAFDRKGGLRYAVALLASCDETVRIHALKLIGFTLMRLTSKRKAESMLRFNVYSLIGEKLLLNCNHLSMATYNALFEVITERMSLVVSDKRHDDPDLSSRIENPQLIKVTALLVTVSKPCNELNRVRRLLLSDLTHLCMSSKDSRRSILQMSVWQDWLFQLAPVYPTAADEQKVTDMVMTLFRVLLHHALKFEYGGWRVWVDTLAILHAKIAFEDFKIKLIQMYQSYENLRANSVPDPAATRPLRAEYASVPPANMKEEESEERQGSRCTPQSVSVEERDLSDGSAKVEEADAAKCDSQDEADSKKLHRSMSAAESDVDEVVAHRPVERANSSYSGGPRPVTLTRSKTLGHGESCSHPTCANHHHPTNRMFSPGPRAPAYRVPEFFWSYLHQKLLSDVLFSIETDLQVWKSQGTKNILMFVNTSENQVYVQNLIHLISQLSDILVTASGGLLSLLAAATSPNGEVEMLESCSGMKMSTAISFLLRLMNIADLVMFASSHPLADLEQEKNMSNGSILRQCLRLVCTCAVRNCLESRYQQIYSALGLNLPSTTAMLTAEDYNKILVKFPPHLKELLKGLRPVSGQNLVDQLQSNHSLFRDPECLLQEMDINRMRAVIYRDLEETKQAQFLALSSVYFLSVLMVSKYRDILEPPLSLPETPSTSSSCTEYVTGSSNPATPEHHDNKSHSSRSSSPPPPPPPVASRPSQMPERLSLKSPDAHPASFVKSPTRSMGEPGSSRGGAAVGKVVTLLTEAQIHSQTPSPSVECRRFSLPDHIASGASSQKVYIREVEEVADEEEDDSSSECNEEQEVESQGRETYSPSVAAAAGIASIQVAAGAQVSKDERDPAENTVSPRPKDLSLSNTEQFRVVLPGSGPAGCTTPEGTPLSLRLEVALSGTAPLLREILVDFSSFLSKTLVGSNGRELLPGGLASLKQNGSSVVELVMLLCSQEWQNSLQKYAGLAFIELVNEGRLISHATCEHIVRVANEAEFIVSRMRAEDVQKHGEFTRLMEDSRKQSYFEENLCRHLIDSARGRDQMMVKRVEQRAMEFAVNRQGIWEVPNQNTKVFYRLDVWEDDSRRRRRFLPDPFGSNHSEAVLLPPGPFQSVNESVSSPSDQKGLTVDLKQCCRVNTTKNQVDNSYGVRDEELSTDTSQTGSGGPASAHPVDTMETIDPSLDSRVNFSSPCFLMAPGVSIKGTLSITKSELSFEMDKEDDNNCRITPQILSYIEQIHGRWHFNEIRAVFSRRYLQKNVALEVFVVHRNAVFFVLPDQLTVKRVVTLLPRVGVGAKYGLPQKHKSSLGTPKQLFVHSNMTQRWQHREISNFDYIMYLNTLSGRTYNDLNQWPTFPWVLTNYESEELDLTSPANFRDLSLPVGALSSSRKAFFEQRYQDAVRDNMPAYHYGVHFSTPAHVLNALVRVQPFTALYLQLQSGKFDHPNRLFHSMASLWKNCQRHTTDVKELTPEFFYLAEMFRNDNGYDFGVNEAGEKVHHIILPPWAKTPEEFVRIHRHALESELVSCQLHQWIDLIFGYKQRGPEAVRATNVFHPLTYEGNVDWERITDPVLKRGIEDQIRHFGQIPSQLLTEPHPPRNSALHVTPLMFHTPAEDVAMVMKFLSNSPIVYVAANTHSALSNPAVTTVSASLHYAVNKWSPSVAASMQQVSSQLGLNNSNQDAQLPLSMDPVMAQSQPPARRHIGDNLDVRTEVKGCLFLTSPDNRAIFSCGYWDKSIRIYAVDSGRLLQVAYGHFDVVTCLARSECGLHQDAYVASGSEDCTVLLWVWSNRRQELVGDFPGCENPTPRATLTGHQDGITCVAVSSELGLVLSGARDGTCLIHNDQAELLRRLSAPSNLSKQPTLLILPREGNIHVIWDHQHLASYSLSGRLLAHNSPSTPSGASTNSSIMLHSVVMSRCGQLMVTAGEDGVCRVIRCCDLTEVYSFPTCDAPIRCLSLTCDHKYLIAGLGSGSLVVFNINFNRWHHEFQERR